MNCISFDSGRRLFTLHLRSSVYAFRVLDTGEVVHLGWASAPVSAGRGRITGEDDYPEWKFHWDVQTRRYEFPARGDYTYHDAAIHASFSAPPADLKPGEAAHGPVRDLRLRYASHAILSDAAPALAPQHGLPTRVQTRRETLAVRLKDDAYAFEVTLFYRLTPEHDILERWVEVRNGTATPVTLQRLDFASVALPNGTTMLTHAAGHWGREFIPVTQPVPQGMFVLEHHSLNTGHGHNPFFLLHAPHTVTEEAGPIWFGALAHGGPWNLRVENHASGMVRVSGGYGLTDFSLTLQPGATHRTPAMVLGCCNEGFGGASRRLHRFAMDRVLPVTGNRFRPVLYNSWEAGYFDVSIENQIVLARQAAAIGVELFCMDDGWFLGRVNELAGLGDWTPDPKKFPNGLRPLADEVKRLGMKFGLWVEPEMTNADSDLYRAHPDWVLHYPGRARREGRNQLILDYGRPEVVEYIFNILDRLVRDNDVDFFKWDMNRYMSESGSVAGSDFGRAHTAAVCTIMDRLRQRHPHLEIQSCSAGGGRADLGVLARCEQVWTSDNTDPFDRTRIQDGYSLIYPARTMECWVTHEKNHQTGRTVSLDLRFDAAMRGALGVGSSLNELSAEELEHYRRKIAFYKRIRPLVQEGDLYRLATSARGGLSAWLFVSPDQAAAVYSLVVLEHAAGTQLPPSILRGLKAEAVYRVSDEHEKELGRYSGYQLMCFGLPQKNSLSSMYCDQHSRTILLEMV